MANSYSGLVATVYGAWDTVSRELTGMIPSAFINGEAARVAKGQEERYPVSVVGEPEDVTYGVTVGESAGDDITYGSMTIQQEKDIRITWTGHDQLALGSTYNVILQDQFEQAMRKLVNAIEADGTALYSQFSRAYGTAGTTPFQAAGDYTDASFVRKILVDNGAPQADLKLVLDTTAGAFIRGKQAQYQHTGEQSLRTQGVLYDMNGLMIRESVQVKTHTKGTGSGYLVNDATDVAVGDTDIVLDTGTGTVLAGDIVNFASAGTYNYVVGTGVAAPGTIVLNNPGARQAIADDAAMTIGNSYVANMAFHKMAVHLLTRLPPMPEGGDSADSQIVVTDPLTGLTFEILTYKQERQVTSKVAISWGWKVVKPEHTALLLG